MKQGGHEPTHLDLFSGIGGFALAARLAGFRTVAFCEIDKYCQKVLAKNFGAEDVADAEKREDWRLQQSQFWSNTGTGSPIFSDIFDFDGTAYRGVSLITGGFPCQPFSVAGKRGGAADDRAIWPQMFRVISEARPAWVLAENVPGIIAMELDNVLSDLEGIGYAMGRCLFQLAPSMPDTGGCGSGESEEMFPTATGRDYKDGTAQSCQNVPVNGLLGRAIHQWPTPHANASTGAGTQGRDGGGENLQTAVGGSLNPAWVEWLMGYPQGWTDLKD